MSLLERRLIWLDFRSLNLLFYFFWKRGETMTDFRMRYISTILSSSGNLSWFNEDTDLAAPISSYFLTAAAAIFALFTILANQCTIVLLLRHRPMQKSISNLYILSLSFADMLIGVLILIVVMSQFLDKSKLLTLSWLCDSWQVADFVLSTISLYSICAIAFDRVWNLEKPLRVLKRSRRLARKLIVCIWLVPIVAWIPYYFFVTENGEEMTLYRMESCTAEYRNKIVALGVAVPLLYVPAVALVAMFGRISIVVHGHFSFLKAHSNNPLATPVLNSASHRGSKDSTSYSRTPEQTKKLSETSTTSISPYGSIRSPRSPSPRFQKQELTPLSEERSSGRERSFSEQLQKIDQFDVDSTNHLRVRNTASNPTRRESLRIRQMQINQKGETTVYSRQREGRASVPRMSQRRASTSSRAGSNKRFSVIAIPSNLADLLQREGVSQQVRAAKAVALILFCFLLCWLPYLVMWPIKLYCPDCIPEDVYNVAVWLNYLCSALNPLLYTLSSPRVRIILANYFRFLCQDTKSRMKRSYYAKSGTIV